MKQDARATPGCPNAARGTEEPHVAQVGGAEMWSTELHIWHTQKQITLNLNPE